MTSPKEHQDMVDWISQNINRGSFQYRYQVELYILQHEGRISRGMDRALNEYFENENLLPNFIPLQPSEPSTETFRQIQQGLSESQAPVFTQEQPTQAQEENSVVKAARRLFDTLRGVFSNE